MMDRDYHSGLHGGSIAMALVSLLGSEVIRHLAADPAKPSALFRTTTRNVSETFPLEVTMDWWAHKNWIMIHIWSVAWLSHAAINLFRRNALGPLSCNPEIHPPVFYLMWTTANCAAICGTFLFDRYDILGALFFKWLCPLQGFCMLFISYQNLEKHKDLLVGHNRREIWFIRYLTQNGLSLFSWWSLMDAVVCLGMVLRYRAGLQDPPVSTAVLSVLLLCIVAWFILDSFLFQKHMRYTFTAYPIFVLGLGAMFTRGYKVQDLSVNTIYCGFLMLLATVLSCVHLIVVCFYTDKSSKRRSKNPLDGCNTVDKPELMDQSKL